MDVENASVDTRVKPQGKLVVWLMSYSGRCSSVSTAMACTPSGCIMPMAGSAGSNAAPPGDDKFLGKIRPEAATGEDFSPAVNIPKPDGMMERALQFVKWLAREICRAAGRFPHRQPAGAAPGSRDHGGLFARSDHGGTVCNISTGGSGGDVLRAARSI